MITLMAAMMSVRDIMSTQGDVQYTRVSLKTQWFY